MLSRRQEYFLDCAREIAAMSQERKRHGCVVVKNGNVVGLGFNKFRNNPDNVTEAQIKKNCSYHAEVVALRQAGTNARGAILFVARLNSNGLDMLSRPCAACETEIRKAGVKKVVWTTGLPSHKSFSV